EVGKGTGLGLSTVYGIVKQSGGYTWVYSEPRIGTAFKIYLPQAQSPIGTQTEAPIIEEEVATGDETILLVEDEAALREAIREFLEINGYKVLPAANAAEALRVSPNYDDAIHLMMKDWLMPELR